MLVCHLIQGKLQFKRSFFFRLTKRNSASTTTTTVTERTTKAAPKRWKDENQRRQCGKGQKIYRF